MRMDDGLVGEELDTAADEVFMTGGFEDGGFDGSGAACLISLFMRLFLRRCGDGARFPSVGLQFSLERWADRVARFMASGSGESVR
jgi:hypothetical protein